VVGTDALLVEVENHTVAQAAYRLIRRLAAEADAHLDPPRDLVPAARTVLLDGVADVDGWTAALSARQDDIEDIIAAGSAQGREIALAIRYDGPDLEVVASTWKCDVDEVVRRHTGTVFTVAFCGFAPGFAYCTSDLPAVPRRDEPRTSVPAGSVGLAGEYCGAYPRAMPGGWQLIGVTDEVLFDVDRDEPALLNPGDRVRFEVAT
jgi:KipI family sensor histidine kinase inhibitor